MKENWTYKKLGDCFPYIKNGANIKQDKNADGYPITRIETLSGGIFNRDRLGYANIYELDKYSEYILSSHDLLMSHINSKVYIGRTVEYIAKEDEKIIHGMNLLRLKCNPQVIYSSFFVYYTHSHDYTSAIAKIRKDAVNQSSFSITDLKKILIPVPPIETQSRIVSELDLLQSIIDKQKAQLKELDNLAQAVFYDMFGDPVENEKGWEVKKLGEVCDITSSKRIFADEYVEKGVPFYRSKEVIERSKGLPISVELFISEERYKDVKEKYGVPELGDILITAVGTIGKIWSVNTEDPFYFKDGNLVWLRKINKEIIDSTFFRASLVLLVEDYKEINANGAAYNALTIIKLKEMQCVLPPLSLQQSFASKIESIEKQKTAIGKSIEETQKLFDYTMDKYFG